MAGSLGDAGTMPGTFVLPPRHRLFAIFDDADAGREAVDALQAQGFAREDDIWVFYGQDGQKRLGLGDGAHGLRMKAVRLVQRAMTSDFGYLELLDDALREGKMVIALKVHDEPSADRLARLLRERSAHSFAYGAHWDFVPVAA